MAFAAKAAPTVGYITFAAKAAPTQMQTLLLIHPVEMALAMNFMTFALL